MPERYSNTERLGVIATDSIITKDFGWIFREMTPLDFGIDALIEQVTNKEPQGKLIAVQIKSGRGNFNVNKKTLTLYVSNIHYHYWLNFDIPVVVVAHLPETDETFWEQINEVTLKKTRTKWKIEIPLKQKLNSKSVKYFEEMIDKESSPGLSFYLFDGELNMETIYDLVEQVKHIANAAESSNKIAEFLIDLSSTANNYNVKLSQFVNTQLTDKSPQVKSALKAYGNDLLIINKRLRSELEILVSTFSAGFYAYQLVIHFQYDLKNDENVLQEATRVIKQVPNSLSVVRNEFEKLKGSIERIPKKYKGLKDARKNLLSTFESLTNEYHEMQKMIEEMIKGIAH